MKSKLKFCKVTDRKVEKKTGKIKVTDQTAECVKGREGTQ